MAPPRKGMTTAVVDDSRSETSSSTKEHKGTSSKGRKGAAASASSKSANSAGVTSAPAQGAEQTGELPRINWSELPVEVLHSYRHAHKLSTPSAFSNEYSRILLSQGIGLRSPTSIAARRAQINNSRARAGASSSNNDNNNDDDDERDQPAKKSIEQPTQIPPTLAAVNHHGRHVPVPGRRDQFQYYGQRSKDRDQLDRIIGQGRVSKNQLALSVRKHFNSAGLVEQEAIARFLYKVREEGNGRTFRLKFQP